QARQAVAARCRQCLNRADVTVAGERRGVSPTWFGSHVGLTPRRSPADQIGCSTTFSWRQATRPVRVGDSLRESPVLLAYRTCPRNWSLAERVTDLFPPTMSAACNPF